MAELRLKKMKNAHSAIPTNGHVVTLGDFLGGGMGGVGEGLPLNGTVWGSNLNLIITYS